MSIEPVYIGTPDKGEKRVLIPAYIPLIRTSFSIGQGLVLQRKVGQSQAG